MDPVFMFISFAVIFAAGAACGYGCRGLVHRELEKAAAEFKLIQADAKADFNKAIAEIKAKL